MCIDTENLFHLLLSMYMCMRKKMEVIEFRVLHYYPQWCVYM